MSEESRSDASWDSAAVHNARKRAWESREKSAEEYDSLVQEAKKTKRTTTPAPKRMDASEEDMNRHERHKLTRVEPPDLERVKSVYLPHIDEYSLPSVSVREKVKEERFKDYLVFLMFCGSEHTDTVRAYAEYAYRCLEVSGYAPTDTLRVDPGTISCIQESVRDSVSSRNLTSLRMMIWLSLRLCPKFVQVFCPPPDPDRSRPFLVNPKILADFRGRDDGALARNLAQQAYTSRREEMTLTLICMEYMRLRPWENADRWQSIDNNGNHLTTSVSVEEAGTAAVSRSAMLLLQQ